MKNEYRVNSKINSNQVRLVDEAGEMIGIVALSEALAKAERAGMDLVEVAENANPPVCKILNYNKFKYDQKKKAKEQAKKNRENKIELKEIWLRPVTERHDLDVKIKHAKEFLEKGDKVKFTVKFKGRELSHIEKGDLILGEVLKNLGEVSIEQPIKRAGRTVTLVVAPSSSK